MGRPQYYTRNGLSCKSFQMIERYRSTLFFSVPTFYAALLQEWTCGRTLYPPLSARTSPLCPTPPGPDGSTELTSNVKMLGFDIVDGRKVVNQAQAAALRQAGEIILREGRAGPVAQWLNEQGWRTTHGKLFSSTTLTCRNRGIFWNPALIGETVINFKEKRVVIYHEGIFDIAKFEAIKVVLDGRRLREPRSVTFYALTGIATCGCGAKWEPCFWTGIWQVTLPRSLRRRRPS
jgi:hypothetical protein